VSTQLSNPASRKQPLSIYVVMLILSALFLFIAVVAMWIEARRYAPDYWQTSTARPNVSAKSVADQVAALNPLG
jgi:hypothetical protein